MGVLLNFLSYPVLRGFITPLPSSSFIAASPMPGLSLKTPSIS
jgi:hypothetical protein